MANAPMRSVICICSKPSNVHDYNCPVANLNRQQSNTILSNEPTYSPPGDQTSAQRTVFASQTHSDGALSTSSTNKSLLTSPLVPFSNPNPMKPSNPSSSVTTIISQQPQLNGYHSVTPTMIMPSLDTGNNCQQFSFPQVITSNVPK